MKKCVYCGCELGSESVIDFCEKCGCEAFGTKMFRAIIHNMREAQEGGFGAGRVIFLKENLFK